MALVVNWSSPAIASVWPSRSSTTVRALRSVIDGTVPPLTVVACAKLSWLMTGSTSSRITSLGKDLGQEREDRAEPLKLDGHHGRSARDRRALRNREREHAADQEPRGLSVEGDQVGLGQDLRQAVGAQGVDEQREVAGVEHAEERRVRGWAWPCRSPPKVPWTGFTKPAAFERLAVGRAASS